MTESKQAANAAAVVLAANREAVVGFNVNTVAEAFRAMSEKRQVLDTVTGEMQNAAIVLIRHAHAVTQESTAAGATEVDKGWSKEVRAMLPMLAKEGSKFVKESEKKEGGFILTGYGQNVNTIARGFCQYPELNPDDCTNEEGEVTFGSLNAAVKARRQQDETDAERDLRLAREALAEALTEYRKAATKGNDALRIQSFADALTEAVTSSDADVVEQDETDDDETETEVEAATG
jgi:hypothetical protein